MHRNARLTERCRQEMVAAVRTGLSPAVAAVRFGVSRTTVYRWLGREGSGQSEWWVDRSSAPHSSPGRIPQDVADEIIGLRVDWGLGPVPISATVGVAPSTVWRVLHQAGISRRPVTPRQYQARYERDSCGDLIHIDTKRAGRIPDGGGRHVRGIEGYRTQQKRRTHTGHVWFHAAIDDHSRLAYVEVLNGRTGTDTASFLGRALTWYQNMGITIRQIMTDNAYEYVQSKQFQTALNGLDHLTIHPYRPQTNGKVERFFRTLKDEWLYTTTYRTENQRQQALTHYLHYYNWHRPHTAINNQPPINRVTNLPEQHR